MQQQRPLMQRVQPLLAGFSEDTRGKVVLRISRMDPGERQVLSDIEDDGLLSDAVKRLAREEEEGQEAVAAAGDKYVPQAWKRYIEKMDKWSEDMVSVDSWPGSMLSKCPAVQQ